MFQTLEQKVDEQPKNKKKMAFSSKLLLTGGAVTGAVYMTGRRIWGYFYPPSFKKYFAVAAMALTILAVKNCSNINVGIKNAYDNTKKTIELRVDRSEEVKELRERVVELLTVKTGFENQEKREYKVLEDAKKYITELEKKHFNTRHSKRKGPLDMIKDNPPDAAFQQYLIHNKAYNSIMHKLDKLIRGD